MSRLNVPAPPPVTHERGPAHTIDSGRQLRRSVSTCLLWENTFYETGNEIANRIAELVPKVEPQEVADLATEARDRLQLRHVPSSFCASSRGERGPARSLKRPLATSFNAPMNSPSSWPCTGTRSGSRWPPASSVDSRPLSASSMSTGSPNTTAPARSSFATCCSWCTQSQRTTARPPCGSVLLTVNSPSPIPGRFELSAGKDNKETFERLLRQGKIGGLAVLRNLRNMQQAGVDEALIRARLDQGIARALPFRFVTAAGYAPNLEDALEVAMLKGAEDLPQLPGKTGLLVDVSGSMDESIARKSETTRIDAAAGLAILLREKAERVVFATFSNQLAVIPPRRGFALRDAIKASQPHQGTYLRRALQLLRDDAQATGWSDLDRVIVITDEQSHDGILPAFTERAYVVNVAPYKHGVSYRDGWAHIDGWSEHVIDYIRESEADEA